MRVLLSTIGTRGEVQPLTALAMHIQELGHQVRACVPPDFVDGLAALGIPAVPLGPRLRPAPSDPAPTDPAPTGPAPAFTPERRRRMIEGTVAAQFATVPDAARGCDLVVGCGALQVAARSAAELWDIGYVHAHFCPVTLPSAHHAPPRLPGWSTDAADNRGRWAADARRWDATWGPALNAHRAALGLDPVVEVRRHLFTDQPWLAADPVLGPWPEPDDPSVVQTGAWIRPDERPLPAELEAFLGAGEPPIYFGLGSMQAPSGAARVSAVMVAAARALGRRALVSRGWADLPLVDGGPGCLLVGEADHQALFPRVAAVVHHGGAGTTTAAARAGTPQVVLPQHYDQFYWAGRVAELGVGAALEGGVPSADALASALDRALRSDVAARAAALAPAVGTDGARVAAARLTGDRPQMKLTPCANGSSDE